MNELHSSKLNNTDFETAITFNQVSPKNMMNIYVTNKFN